MNKNTLTIKMKKLKLFKMITIFEYKWFNIKFSVVLFITLFFLQVIFDIQLIVHYLSAGCIFIFHIFMF